MKFIKKSSIVVMKLRRVVKTLNKIRLVDLNALIDFDAHLYSLCAHINSIIFYTLYINIDSILIVF